MMIRTSGKETAVVKTRETNSTREREVEEFVSSEINLYALYNLLKK